MIANVVKLIRICADPRITRTPLRVLRELRSRGVRRLPDHVDRKISRGSFVAALGLLREWLGAELLSRHKGQWVLNSFVPPFPGPAFNRAFENLLSGRRFSPVSAFVAITAQCPYRCWHCSIARRTPGNLTTEQWVSALEQLHSLGTGIIGFTGGEPLLRDDLPVLVKTAADLGTATILFTAGATLTEQKVRGLVDAGLWALCVSLDAPDAVSHDELRGAEGSFETALRAMRLSKQAGFYSMIGVTATRRFVEERWYESVYKIAQREKMDEVRIVEPMPCGKLAREQEQYLLTPRHTQALREFHRRVNRRGRLPKVCSFNQIESPEVFGCAGGIQHLYIDSAGTVCPCDFTPLGFGTVVSEPLETIYGRMSTALGRPRRHCMIQKHHALFAQYADQGFPLPPDVSLEVARRMPPEPLPGYYAMVMQPTPDATGESLKSN